MGTYLMMKKTKLKYHFKFGMGETILREEVSDNPTDGYPVYSATESDTVFGYKSDIKRVLDAGDIIIAARGTIGSVNILKEKGGCTQTTIYMKNLGDFNSYYVYYYLLGHRDTMFAYDKTAIPQLTISKFSNEEILLPSVEVQNRIVAFLDAETSKLDSLAEELTKFKANLQLQKRSLVSECVTKGIPSERDRAYKDSGVEWLGEIPVGWEIRPFGKSVTLGSKKTKVTANRISLDMIESGSGKVIFNEENDFVGDGVEFQKGDVLFGKLRPYLNKSYYAESEGDAFGDIHVYKPSSEVDGKYLFYFTLSDGFVKEANRTASGVKMPRASWSNITKFAFTVPPLDEQKRIANYLDVETAKIDSLIGEIDNQVNLLKTYRKSLINEVVTGKVEV
jgi:type I restriction enzyme, S subunit